MGWWERSPQISSFQCHIPGPAQHIQPGDYPGHVLLPYHEGQKLSFFLQKSHSANYTLKAKHGHPKGLTAVCPSSSGSHVGFYALSTICALPSALSSSLCAPSSRRHFLAPASPWSWVGAISWQGLVFPPPKCYPAPLVCFIIVLILWPFLESKAGQERRRSHSLAAALYLHGEGSDLRGVARSRGVWFCAGAFEVVR